MLLTNDHIDVHYTQGIISLSNITFTKFRKDLYGITYRNNNTDFKLLMLLYGMNSWDNTAGADNWLNEVQMLAILDNMGYANRDESASCPAPRTVNRNELYIIGWGMSGKTYYIPGDFDNQDFNGDFNGGITPAVVIPTDFNKADFNNLDFNT